MIEIRGLTHSYGRKTVLSNVNLVIEPREKCALVGRNGAGKSTLIHSMLGILPVQQGEVLLRGIPNTKEEWKQYVSYLPEKFSLYAQMSGLENMEFFAELAGVPANSFRIEQCLRRVQLWEDRNEKVR
ncbi:ATP-binding cassette domain-containing protein, partial [Effusibacillus lacus]